jgi:hypothetical protein
MSSKPRDDADDASRPRTDWGRVADGVGLAGLGIFFLVATTRGLPDGFWIDAVSFWPVLLVSAGIRIVFEKTSLAAGMVLGPVVVLGTLFWLAWGDRPALHPPGEWHELSAAEPEGIERARVSAKLSGVRVDLESRSLGPGLLAEGQAASRETTPRLEIDERDGEATVRLKGRRSGFMMIGTRREVWELGVTDALPLEVKLNGAFVRGDFDLRRGFVTYAEVNGAFNSAIFRLPPPSGPVKVRFKGAFSTFDVKVPEGTPVRYHGPGFPIVWGDRAPAKDGIGEDTPGYEVILEGAFSVVNIEEGPAPEGGWPAPRPSLESPEADTDTPDQPAAEEDETGGSSGSEAAPHPPAEAEPGPPPEDPEGA